MAGTILLRAPVEELGLCRLLAARLTPWPDLGTSCLAGCCCSSSSTTTALLIGLLARFATLILLLTVLGLRRLPVALVTGDGTVGVNAVVGAGCLLVDVNWVLGSDLILVEYCFNRGMSDFGFRYHSFVAPKQV